MKVYGFLLLLMVVFFKAESQIKVDQIFDLNDLSGKLLTVKKGYAPKFSLGSLEITDMAKVAGIFNVKGNMEAIRLFNTFKTGRTIYRVAAAAGTAIVAYGSIRALDKAARTSDYRGAILGGLSAVGAGLLTKLLTKAAAYKAVNVFNGVATRKIKDILSFQPASSMPGMGLYVKLN